MEFLPNIYKWIEILLRWSHVMFAILWVGNSFLFNYLDNKLNRDISSEDIDGEGYLMHSGYYYKLTRLKKSPPLQYLNSLVIFKWQSYLTFVTGVLLLIVIYYYNSGVLMVDKRVLQISPLYAILISLLSLIVSWFVYDFLCKSKLINNKIIFPVVLLIIGTVISFSLTKIFGSRFAFLSVGVILGCIMFFNVFFVIIPNGKNITLNKEKFDLNLSISAKTRSVHNNIITFLVLFVMLSGHYSFIWISQYNWIILSFLAIILGLIRHYFNLRAKKTI